MTFQFGGNEFRPIITRMWGEKAGLREIGRAIGKSKTTVKRLAKRFGLPEREMARGWVAKRERAPKPVGPEPIGPIGAFPDTMDCCRFIAGDPTESFQCCGHPGFPWCDFHKKSCTTKPTGRML
jgi:hypothetical protein